MAVVGMQTSSADYQRALEGVGYGSAIIRKKSEELNDIMQEINKPDFMDGETGKEYVERISQAISVSVAVVEKFEKFSQKVNEICIQNGGQVDQLVQSADEQRAKFMQIAEQIAANKGHSSAQ